MAITEKTANYLDHQSYLPLVYGDNDCCLFPANLCKILTGIDPGEPFRGQYNTEIEALNICENVGGLPILINRAFINCGFSTKYIPSDGDCGCVFSPSFSSVGCIFYNNLVWIKMDNGVAALNQKDVRIMAIWNVSELYKCLQ